MKKPLLFVFLFETTYNRSCIIFFNPRVSLKAAGCGFWKDGGQLCCDTPDKSVYPMESLAGFILNPVESANGYI